MSAKTDANRAEHQIAALSYQPANPLPTTAALMPMAALKPKQISQSTEFNG